MDQNSPDQTSHPDLIQIQAAGDAFSSRRGEASEAAFLARATSLGFCVAVPWGNSRPFDNLVQFGRIFWRVQVKGAGKLDRGRYSVRSESDGSSYTKENIDFIAAHAVPPNLWYIVPIEAFAGKTSLGFSPHRRSCAQYEKYREAWCLLSCPMKSRGWKDIPTVCRNQELGAQCAVCPLRK